MEPSNKNVSSDASDMSDLFSLWSVQDSLLQSYRSMFVTAQSVVMSLAAAIAASKPTLANVLPLAVLGGVLMVAWLSVTLSRTRDVTFAQKLILWAEQGQVVARPLAAFKEYQRAWAEKSAYMVEFTNGSKESFKPKSIWLQAKPRFKIWKWGTRIHMEVIVPAGFGLCWIWVLLYVVYAS